MELGGTWQKAYWCILMLVASTAAKPPNMVFMLMDDVSSYTALLIMHLSMLGPTPPVGDWWGICGDLTMENV